MALSYPVHQWPKDARGWPCRGLLGSLVKLVLRSVLRAFLEAESVNLYIMEVLVMSDMVNLVIICNDGKRFYDGACEQSNHKELDQLFHAGIGWLTDLSVKSFSIEKSK